MIRALAIGLFLAAQASCLPEGSDDQPDQPLIGSAAGEAQRQACENRGGRWAQGGLAGTLVCYITPPDAGKSCLKSTDCTTECLARTRTCAPVTPLFGCNDIFDSRGRVVALCRD